MTNTTTPTKLATTKTKSNGEEHSQEPVASTSPTPPPTTAPDKKPITVLVSEQTHRKVKITAELSGVSLSDLVEAQLKILVKEKLPALLAGLDAEG
jgi:predicted HicB family RNase H-like nuclease